MCVGNSFRIPPLRKEGEGGFPPNMFRISLKRTLFSGYLNFRRNAWLSAATILVMVLALFVLGSLTLLSAFSQSAIAMIESRLDMSIYFVQGAEEDDIFSVKKELESLPDVAEVNYISREAALAEFRERYSENALILSALEEIGENPLEASLNVKARDPSRLGTITQFLTEQQYPTVDKINYFENQHVIERLTGILGAIRGSVVFLTLFLAFVAALVAFNTIRLAIYTMREEVAIMRLVGGTRWFIQGPFLVSGALYGIVAALIVTLIFVPLTWLMAPKLSFLLPSFDIFKYFLAGFMEFFAILAAAGVGLGVLSSLVAVRRYLKV